MVIAAVLFVAPSTSAQEAVKPAAFVEAEAARVVCSIEGKPGESLFASGGRFTPWYWGQAVGDRVDWTVELKDGLAHPLLAVRYAYGKEEFAKNPNSARRLHVVVDGQRPSSVAVPDTGAWLHYEVAWVALPRLTPGEHVVSLRPFEELTNTDVDCLGLFESKPRDPMAPFVKTLVAISDDGRFHYRRSALAKVPEPARVFAQFARIHAEMKSYSGWVPAAPIGIQVIEDRLWPNPGATAFSNGAGCFFKESLMPNDYGNWSHEMNHLMFNGHCAAWLEEPLVRVMTSLVWVPRLFADDAERKLHMDSMAACGKEFREHPERCFESLDFVLRAMADRFGPDLFGKFLRACSEAAAKDELSLAPFRKMTTAEVVKYLSIAAGEDVTPMLRRWSGFDGV